MGSDTPQGSENPSRAWSPPNTPLGSSDLIPVSLGEMGFRHKESKLAKNYTPDDPSAFQKSKVTFCHSVQPHSDQSEECQPSQLPEALITHPLGQHWCRQGAGGVHFTREELCTAAAPA